MPQNGRALGALARLQETSEREDKRRVTVVAVAVAVEVGSVIKHSVPSARPDAASKRAHLSGKHQLRGELMRQAIDHFQYR